MNGGWDARKLFQQVGTNQSRMTACSAGQDFNSFNSGIEAVIERQCDRPIDGQPCRQMPSHPESSRLRLLMDLLEHEMTELPFVGHLLGGAELGRQPMLTLPSSVVELHTQR